MYIYATKSYDQANQLEDTLQRRFHHLPLGRRLWRDVAKEGYTEEQKYHEGNLLKVFLTFAPIDVLDKVKVNHWKLGLASFS